jgi:outer membrane receptor protein involved in Fe transport
VSEERVLDGATGTNVVTLRDTGGTQLSSGTFAQAQVWLVPQFSVSVSGRVDHWRNFDAFHNEQSVATGLPTATHRGPLAEKEDTVFSPRLGALYHVTDKVTAWGSIGSGFRAPTLNELYRQFSVGAVVTRANAELSPERLVGGELGVNVAPASNVTVRATWFDNAMRDPISNVTIGTNLAQRQNLGRTRIRGLQTDVEYRMGNWRTGGGYVFNRARVTEFVQPVATQPSIVGNFLAQVPKNRGSVSVSYSNPRYVTASVNAIFVGEQFDNDINTLVLPAYGTVELSLVRAIGRNLDVFFTAQNLFDQEYFVQRNPTTIGAPRLVSGGIRVRFSGQ